MRILVQMPNWLGDAVMATPALNNLCGQFPRAQFVVLGSPAVAELLSGDPRFLAVVANRTRTQGNRLVALWHLGRQLRNSYGPFQTAWTFLNSFSSRWLLYATRADQRIGRRRGLADLLLTRSVRCQATLHHSEIYGAVVNGFLQTHLPIGPTTLHVPQPHRYPRLTVGIHPGAAYGGAKRWDPQKFAETAAALSRQGDLVVFGGPNELELAAEVEGHLRAGGVTNYTNLAGRTSIPELVARIAGLNLLICNDSGPMHIAGACRVPTVTIFGSTDPAATRPWLHDRFRFVRRDLPCSPCLKRTCPLQHHACMREIQVEQVVQAARELLPPGAPAAAS